MEHNTHAHIILEYLSNQGIQRGDGVPVDEIMDYGFSLDQVEGALIAAALRGWIVMADHHIHLTRLADIVINPANDNKRNDR